MPLFLPHLFVGRVYREKHLLLCRLVFQQDCLYFEGTHWTLAPSLLSFKINNLLASYRGAQLEFQRTLLGAISPVHFGLPQLLPLLMLLASFRRFFFKLVYIHCAKLMGFIIFTHRYHVYWCHSHPLPLQPLCCCSVLSHTCVMYVGLTHIASHYTLLPIVLVRSKWLLVVSHDPLN